MSTASGIENLIERLKARFGSDIRSAEMLYDVMTIEVPSNKIIDVLHTLKSDEQTPFQFLTSLCGMHYPHFAKDRQFGVVYHMHCLTSNIRLRIKIFLHADKLEVDTATELYATANWMERETFDFYGIRFKGHPNLIRILNMEDMVAFPMRKDFPLEDQRREDKADEMFGR
jgi:NADH-quinone oxidoreductase subunit C